MDAGLKKRLVGAAVLIALAVIFVPMLLPSASGPRSGSVEIPPPPSGEMETRVLQVGPDRASAGGSTAAAIADPDHVATLDLNGARSSAPVAVSAEAASAAPVPVAATPPAGASIASSPEAARQAPEPAAPVTSAMKPEPLPGGPGAAAGTVYTVNLGIYADHASARKLVANAKQHGFTALATPENYQGKSVLRVRVGPFADRGEAEAARLKLKGFEHVAMTVEAASVDQADDAPSSALPAAQPGAWAVQLAAFSEQSSAVKLRDRLRSQGFDGYVDSKGQLWRVRAGPFATREVAESTRARIADQIKIKGIIVTQR